MEINSYFKLDKTLLIHEGRQYSYKEFVTAVFKMKCGIEKEAKQNSIIGIYSDNPWVFYTTLLAIWASGNSALPLNTTLNKSDLSYIADISKPSFIVTDTDSDDSIDFARKLDFGSIEQTKIDLPSQFQSREIKKSIILFTSGSTGIPKGVCTDSDKILKNSHLISKELNYTSQTRMLINTPPYFTSAICHFMSIFINKATIGFHSSFAFGDSLVELGETIQADIFGGSPAHIVKILASRFKETSFKKIISSGDHLPKSIIRQIKEKFSVEVHTLYGLTEASGRLCFLHNRYLGTKAGSVGKPLDGMSVDVRNKLGDTLLHNQSGEVYISGAMMMDGYLLKKNLPHEAIRVKQTNRIGFATGDIGYLDIDGFLWLEGRKDDVFKCGGEKVSLIKIHQTILGSGLLQDAGVLSEENELMGKVPVAYVVPKEKDFRLKDLRIFLKKELPKNHLPYKYHVVDRIPRTGSGKIIKKKLREV